MSSIDTMTDDEQPITAVDLAEQQVEPDSVVDLLRRKREEVADAKTVDIAVPGYNNSPPILLIRYHLIDGPTMDRIGRKIMRQTKDKWSRQVFAAIDTMIEAIEGFYVDMQDGSEVRPLTLHGDPVTTFGPELQEVLQLEAQTARETVQELFNHNDVALASHNVQLSRWMGNTTGEVDEEFLGNP